MTIALDPPPPTPVSAADTGSTTDAQLAARASQGDRAAFECLVERYGTVLFNYACRLMGGSRDDAHDLSQEALLKAWVALRAGRFAPHHEGGARPWLYRIVHNACLDEIRNRSHVTWQPWDTFVASFHPTQVAGDQPDVEAERAETRQEVAAILAQLPPKWRTVLVLRDMEARGCDEIALLLGTTVAAVKALLYRARTEFALLAGRERAVAAASPTGRSLAERRRLGAEARRLLKAGDSINRTAARLGISWVSVRTYAAMQAIQEAA